MDRISRLPEELLVKILSFVPTKVAVSTSILSKQWKFLWKLVPKLEYDSRYYSNSECERLQSFLNRNLPLHRAPLIESFCLEFSAKQYKPEDIKLWVLTAVSRNLRELEISQIYSLGVQNNILPSSLYTCKTLLTLKLYGTTLVDVPRMICLPCLKTLQLEGVTYDLDEIVIKTPSLKYLNFTYYSSKIHHCLIENMPKLREAYVDVSCPILKRLIGSITSIKRLTLWQGVYGDGFVFNHLVHLNLNIRIFQRYSLNVLVRLLKDSSMFRVLDLHHNGRNVHGTYNGVRLWNQPSTVPECMLSSLQTFKFSGYLGRPEERDLVIYVLKNAHHLKTATILSKDYLFEENPDMIQELALSPRASTDCQLVLDRAVRTFI
ncbi:FBD-associated F-box protein At4g10400 [Eutrema salsugineum]|uniref:FBD-associated F-box protein At4g10400 n=1 Tax=Eutrema salsugineum TaxID=72664 RepID=UPI000CECF07C|nr:FBD-associated F-box protein At4g10400 [Eutrema salsugineum]